MKYIEHPNPFVAGGVSEYPVIRETKTQYICKHTRFHKPRQEYDGCYVCEVGGGLWEMGSTLRITQD
jgi:hypothetical protein